jgi:5-methylcytosine-specific restriction endonuclease McrA
MKLCGRGCARAIPDDARCCDECAAERGLPVDGQREHRGANVYGDELDALRKGKRWQDRRAKVLRKDPMCADCKLTHADIVDHIVPAAEALRQVRESKRFPFDRNAGYYLISNLQGLCRSCHGKKTLRDQAHSGEWPSVLEAEDKLPKKVWSF